MLRAEPGAIRPAIVTNPFRTWLARLAEPASASAFPWSTLAWSAAPTSAETLPAVTYWVISLPTSANDVVTMNVCVYFALLEAASERCTASVCTPSDRSEVCTGNGGTSLPSRYMFSTATPPEPGAGSVRVGISVAT